MNVTKITLVLGTAREGRASDMPARWMVEMLEERDDIALTSVDVRDFQLSRTYEAWNDHEDNPLVGTWRQIANDSDGFIIMTPEYNHGYPGELKILLDSAFSEYRDKPVMLVGLSGGNFGGARVVDHIKPVLTAMGMRPIGADVHFSSIDETFSDGGEIDTDVVDDYTERVNEAVASLLDHAQQMRSVRM